MKRGLITIALLGVASFTLAADAPNARVAVGPQTHLSLDRPVHAIDLPHYQSYIPAGTDRELFASRCLSCHSTRYISMQPPMPQAKWEENVKKMIKTYGAPIPEDEAPRLAAYLVAFQASAPDPLEGTTQQTTELPPLGQGDVEHGKQVYASACASCHGAAGKGDGANMAALLPHATNLTDGRFSPVAIQASVLRGVRGTAMPSFAALSNDDVNAVVAYVQTLYLQGLGAKDDVVLQNPDPAAKALYDNACASCHGATGGGDGFNASILSRSPTNFRHRQTSSQSALNTITNGLPGTPMPSWKAKFDDKQRAILADYVRSFYGKEAAH